MSSTAERCAVAWLDANTRLVRATSKGDSSGMIGVYNIAVVPRARSRGVGRAMTVRVLEDGFAGGADTAYPQSSTAGRPLYESMGFRHVDTWSRFTTQDDE